MRQFTEIHFSAAEDEHNQSSEEMKQQYQHSLPTVLKLHCQTRDKQYGIALRS